jgi:cyanophycinase-like exopeptidase
MATTASKITDQHRQERGRMKRARDYFERALETEAWTSLGFIVSERDLARLP